MKSNKWKRRIAIPLGAVCLSSNIVMFNAAEMPCDKEINNKVIQDVILVMLQNTRDSFCRSEKKEKYSYSYNTADQKELNFEFNGNPKKIKNCEIFFADVTHNNTKKAVIFVGRVLKKFITREFGKID